jgi:hypothetical protein
MKILYITTSYPPFFDMGTIRNQKIIKGLTSDNHNVTVLSASIFSDENKENIIDNNLTEWRTKKPFFYRVKSKIENKSKILLKIWNILGGKVFFPDTFAFWSFTASKLLEKKDISTFDLVISSSGSYLSHILANKVSRNYDIPWFSYYGDPWSFNGFGKRNILVSLYEKKLLKKCNLIGLTTYETIECYKELIKGMKHNIEIAYIPCGYDSINNIEGSTFCKPNVINIVYTGVAYSRDRDLTNTILAVNKSEKTIFSIVGSYSDKYQKIKVKPESINFLGRVEYNKSLDIINEADVLLHIGNYGALQIPGKTYSYLSSCKPILYIRQEEGHDPTLELLKKFNGVYVVNNNVDEIQKVISYINNNYLKVLEESKERYFDDNLQLFSWDNISEIFNSEVEKLKKK